MDIKHLQFSFRMYWANMKGLLNMVAEGIILVASLASLFILVYQFGFKYSAHVTHMLETSRVYLLLAFFTGISLRYILKFKEIIQEKMLYLDIGIYFFLFAVLSGKVFFKEAIHQSLPYLGFLTEPLFALFPPAVAERHPFVAADIHAVTKPYQAVPPVPAEFRVRHPWSVRDC